MDMTILLGSIAAAMLLLLSPSIFAPNTLWAMFTVLIHWPSSFESTSYPAQPLGLPAPYGASHRSGRRVLRLQTLPIQICLGAYSDLNVLRPTFATPTYFPKEN